ncbi:hypothetical protein GCM10010121_069880 [Streptomyces brasiliensis]|uniref:Uncharacterized protein n=1 Tax=Streptomyces brasiliensis TaxID=1954 RepID=A0A917P2F5_9ACTN|nr:hypothetical protein GCM10010121_069880 [Streptomyces brasiliensis]
MLVRYSKRPHAACEPERGAENPAVLSRPGTTYVRDHLTDNHTGQAKQVSAECGHASDRHRPGTRVGSPSPRAGTQGDRIREKSRWLEQHAVLGLAQGG